MSSEQTLLEQGLATIPKEMASVTKNFAILTHVDEIQDRIFKDADERMNSMKEDLCEQVAKSINGEGSVKFYVPVIYRDYTIHSLKKWTKLHNYAMEITGGYLRIRPRKHKLPKKRCDACYRQRSVVHRKLFRYTVLGAAFAGFVIVWTWVLGG